MNPGGGNDNTPPLNGNSNGGSVCDVTQGCEPSDDPAGNPLPRGALRARIRNESSSRADVTLRFLQDDVVVHLAFVRILSATTTTIDSPRLADVLELFGQDQSGRALPSATLLFGRDFDEDTAAEYVIRDVDGPPIDTEPATITLLEPDSDITLALGSSFNARWTDAGGGTEAVVRIFLRPVSAGAGEGGGADEEENLLSVSPSVNVALDGLNDELTIVLQGISPGPYDVVARIMDGDSVVESVASGRVTVVLDESNSAPTMTILSPRRPVEVTNGGTLTIRWSDDDPDDNATIRFVLAGAEGADVALGSFDIGPPIAEDPDGPSNDSVVILIEDVLPGLYDLEGRIGDGELMGTAREPGVVRVLAEEENDPPTISIVEPAGDITVSLVGSFRIRWEDADENDDARISLLLDPDTGPVALDGNEILLAASIGEDAEGPGDALTLGIPIGTSAGSYRLAAAITDGRVEFVARSAGLIVITPAVAGPNPGGGGGPPLVRSLSVREPSTRQKTRLGERIPVRIDATDIPASTDVRLELQSVNEEGTMLRVDVTPDFMMLNTDWLLRIPDKKDVIPNDWWPRDFVLRASATVDGTTFSDEAQAVISIRQEVEIRNVRMLNYACYDPERAEIETGFPQALEIEWFGGGFSNPGGIAENRRDPPIGIVEFWLSDDPFFDDGGVEEVRRRLLFSTTERPNALQVTQIDYLRLIGADESDSMEDVSLLKPRLLPGEYRLSVAVETDEFDRLISPPFPETVEVCFPVPRPPLSTQR